MNWCQRSVSPSKILTNSVGSPGSVGVAVPRQRERLSSFMHLRRGEYDEATVENYQGSSSGTVAQWN